MSGRGTTSHGGLGLSFVSGCLAAFIRRILGGKSLETYPFHKYPRHYRHMVERRVVQLVDDLDGSQAGETVHFAVDGRDYEIDLSAKNARKLRAVLRPYVSAGRRTGTRRAQPARGGRSAGSATTNDSQQIREWARGRGLEVSARGRIPAYLRQAYERR